MLLTGFNALYGAFCLIRVPPSLSDPSADRLSKEESTRDINENKELVTIFS